MSSQEAMLSAHFSARELSCHHCGVCHVDAKLLIALEALRTIVGPLTVLSGYRCPLHNAEVGGKKASEHQHGTAADVTWPGITMPEAFRAAEQVPGFLNGGIGLYPQENFVHVDVRGHEARWARVNGNYVGIQEALK